jgi:hypothetical protein
MISKPSTGFECSERPENQSGKILQSEMRCAGVRGALHVKERGTKRQKIKVEVESNARPSDHLKAQLQQPTERKLR